MLVTLCLTVVEALEATRILLPPPPRLRYSSSMRKMFAGIKSLARKLPRVRSVIIKLRDAFLLFALGGQAGVFDHIRKRNRWGSEESLSGPGSTLQVTEVVRRELPIILHDFNVVRILDAPCGDFNWMKTVSLPDTVWYHGGDIVQALVDTNNKNYLKARRSFGSIDITRDQLASADLWLCRDCLIHLSNNDVAKVIANFKRSSIKYLLTTTYPQCPANADIFTGGFREINLELPPFSFPKPLRCICEGNMEQGGPHLGLWTREQILDATQ